MIGIVVGAAIGIVIGVVIGVVVGVSRALLLQQPRTGRAAVAEQADAPSSSLGVHGREGSTPSGGTTHRRTLGAQPDEDEDAQ